MSSKRILVLIPVLAAAALLLGTFLWALPKSMRVARKSPCVALGLSKPAHDVPLKSVTLKDLEGRSHRLDEWRNRVLLLNFWLTTCRPCLEELPSLLEVARRYAKRGLMLVLVSTDKKQADIDAFLKKIPRLANLPSNVLILHDPGGKVANRFGTTKYPETYLFAPDGASLGVAVGPRNWSDRAGTACVANHLP